MLSIVHSLYRLLRAFPNWCKWGKLLLGEASSLVKEIS